ncbi:MAG TPA: YbaL family putative K(+) efflux transporter [Xanthobacteraceae bacterium]|nr:YbaL family putative K(+) efflux transporter [Xanthobacteraceae bacterium]
MAHHSPLIGTVVAGLVLAFVFGTLANRLKISPLVGYLLAGVVVGPYTPGYVADQGLAGELAELGVILLMFGVGLHFSLKDLLSVKGIALPGALAQTTIATLLGMLLAKLFGWNWSTGFVFGLALSVASTVVLTRSLQERRIMETERGRIAIGWLVVQDMVMVLALVFIPAMASVVNNGTAFDVSDLAQTLAITIAKVAAFVALMFVVGRRVIPEILHYVVHMGSRELFRLAVLAIALGVAYGAAELFGISFALGAFFAGMMLSESTLSQRAAEESLPLRDAFAVLFFVSVGMLFNPKIIIEHPGPLFATLAIILIFNPIAAYLIVRLFGHPISTALTIGASLAQIGEFSFILGGLGLALKILPQEGEDLILAGAIITILVNPFYFVAVTYLKKRLQIIDRTVLTKAPPPPEEPEEIPETSLTNHAVIVGYGRVGTILGARLKAENQPYLVIEDRKQAAETIRQSGIEVVQGNAADPRIIKAANLPGARWLFIAIPDGFEAGQVAEQARKLNPKLDIIARAHSDAEVEHLEKHKANFVIMGEREIAYGMLEHAFGAFPAEPQPDNSEAQPS